MITNVVKICLLFLLIVSCNVKENTKEIKLIAHAGGAVNGIAMTNSLEALHSAREKGFEYIELDLLFTSDSMLVAGHSWHEYNTAMGMPEKGDSAPTTEFFSSSSLPGGFTPLTAKEINDFFLSDEKLFFVTDKISDVDVLDRFFPLLKKRMLVEAFCYDDYVELCRKGYKLAMYSCMAEDINTAPIKHLLFHFFFPGPKIEYIALHTSAFDYLFMKFINFFSSFKIALFTVNDFEDIPKKYMNDIEFVYTDFISPDFSKP